VEEDSRSFTALGATGQQSIVEFQTQNISALEAIASVGGLNPRLADPSGVFVLRNEPEQMANAVLGRHDLVGTQRFVYVLDLTAPTGMFEARDFAIRDEDTVYVTSAPISQWNNAISALTGTLTSTAGLAKRACLDRRVTRSWARRRTAPARSPNAPTVFNRRRAAPLRRGARAFTSTRDS
jgi:polysaccharide export outer membrane protein